MEPDRTIMRPAPAGLLALFGVCAQIGLLSFGGGLTGWVHREVVSRRAWMTEDDFLNGVALGQVLPGTNISNLMVYIGQRLHGPLGAVVALFGLLVGPFFAVIGLSAVYGSIAGMPWIQHAMDGTAAAAIGLILLVALRGGSRAFAGVGSALVFLAAFMAVGVLQWPLVPVVLVLTPLSVAWAWWTIADAQ
jgi:chromate transporter